MSLTERKRQFKTIGFLILLSISLTFPFIQNNFDFSYEVKRDSDFVKTSAQRSVTKQWIKNSNFSSVPIEPTWYCEKGAEGDNSDMNATTSTGQANFEVLGETKSFSVTSGTVNSSSWYGWGIYNNSDFLLPDNTTIDNRGCFTYHFLNETDAPGQVHNFPSVHFRKNVSMPDDMSDYVITDVSLEVIFNASVNTNVDSFNDWDPTASTVDIDMDKFEIGDSAHFYADVSDINNAYLYNVGNFETRDVALGQHDRGYPVITNITNQELNYVDDSDLIANLNSALETDHTNFAINLGLDIYCEDNRGTPGDDDEWYYLIFKSVNLTITYVKKIDQFTTLSWNQKGNTLNSTNVQVTDAKFFFKYKINNKWPSTAPLSEIIFYLNDKSYSEGIIKLSAANTSWQEAKVGGFDVTSLISTDVNITVSIEVFLKDTFELNQTYSISIDDVYLNISYIETFPDYVTDLELFLDGKDKTLDPVIQIPIKDMLNITVTYIDNVSGDHISADSHTLEGKVSGDLTENITLEQYSFIVNSTELGFGISVLTLTLQKVNYETESIQIFVEVIERETVLQLSVDETPRSNNETVDVSFNEFLNFTVFYKDNLTNTYIDAASVELLGFGSMNETLNQYNFTLNTNDLSQGVNVLTIFAQKSNFQSQTIQFYINVDIRSTELFLFVNGVQKNQSDTIQFDANELINITVFYKDSLTSSHLSGANVELLGINNLAELGSHFNITINSNNLTQGINILTLFAQLTNYQPKSIQFFIEVVERTTQIQLFLNEIDKTADPVLELPIGTMINITIKFYDNQTGLEIPSAVLQLIGESISENLNESLFLNQYSIILNSSSLSLGIKLFTIVAQASTYQINTIDIRITVNPVSISINTVSYQNYVDMDPNEDFLIQINLTNEDFGGTIKNATVTYSWVNGQGILTDSNNDGIYEATLYNVPVGLFFISINAYAGENYDFDDFEITLNVEAPSGPDITIIIISLAAGVVGLSVGFVLYQTHFKYPPKVRMMRKVRKKIDKGKKLKPLIVSTRDNIITSEIERSKEILSIENEIVDKISKKIGGDSLE